MNAYEIAGISRRAAIAEAGVFLIANACNPQKLFGTEPIRVPRKFFGHMVAGGLLSSPDDVDIPFGTYRIWNNGASYEWVYRNRWEGFEGWISFAESKGADALYVLFGEPNTDLPSLDAWRSFVREAVERSAGRVQVWEPINEAVYVASPEQALAYAAEAYSIIKASQPTAVVTTPSLNDLTRSYAQTFAETYLAKVGDSTDVVAFHSYDSRQDLARVIGWLHERTALPLWNTETVGIETLEVQARAGVERVVLNAQIAGNEDWDAESPLGRVYCATFDRLAA